MKLSMLFTKNFIYNDQRIFLVMVSLSLMVFSGCKSKKVETDPNVFYTCSMDPQVMEKKPGKCPICKMELTKTIIAPDQDKESLKLSDDQIRLGNVKFQKVEEGRVGQVIKLRGTLAPDERKTNLISSRVSGRIEKLYFKSPGEHIKKGDRVYDIYSEELKAAIEQYLLLKEKSKVIKDANINYHSMVLSAKEKLTIFGLSDKQIKNLSPGNSTIPFYSNISGTVSEVLLNEGDYVQEGSVVLKATDLSSLWVMAEAYPDHANILKPGQEVKVTVEGFSDHIDGKINFENPVLENQSRINLYRIEISNKGGNYKPGMFADVSVLPKQSNGITIPVESILFQPEMNRIWVTDGKGLFKPKMVRTGIIDDGYAEILSGIKDGELVVISGAYLLDSEYRLRNGSSDVHEGHAVPAGEEKQPVRQH